jgi:hypothetical protein
MKLKKAIILLLVVSVVFMGETVLADEVNIGDTVTINVENVPIQESIDNPRVIWKIPKGTQLELLEKKDLFYNVNYNGTLGWILKTYTKEGAAANVGEFSSYKQMGQIWSSIKYSQGNIGTSGCGPTSAAICISGLGDYTNPGGIVQEGYKVYKSFVAGTYSNRLLLNNIGYNLSENVGAASALKYLNDGNPIICHAGPGFYTSYGHFMALIGVRGNEVYLSDPYSYSLTRNGWIDINTLMSRGVDAFYVVTRKI